jgi:hypothetical protein
MTVICSDCGTRAEHQEETGASAATGTIASHPGCPNPECPGRQRADAALPGSLGGGNGGT